MTSSLVDYLRNLEQVALTGQTDIEARLANQHEAMALGIRRGQLILVRRTTFFTKGSETVFTVTSIYRANLVS